MRAEIEAEFKKIRAERVSCEKSKVDLKAVEIDLREKIERMEKDWTNFVARVVAKLAEFKSEVNKVGYAPFVTTGDGKESGMSEFGVSKGSTHSGKSLAGISCLSVYEVNPMKKLVKWKKVQNTQENIVLKDILLSGDWYIGVGRFLKEKLNVEVHVLQVKKRGGVFVVKIYSK